MKEIGFLFDLDGVLIDSESEYTRIWNEIEEKYPTGKKDFALAIKGQTLNKILTENYPDPVVREKVKEMLHDRETKMVYRYCPGAEGFLNRLRAEGRKVALVTSSDSFKMAHLYKDVPDFREKIDVIIDASKVKRSKPDPEGYLLAASQLGLGIEDCIVFEDSVQGVMAGRNAGAFVIGIAGTKRPEELAPYADMIVNSLDEVNLDKIPFN